MRGVVSIVPVTQPPFACFFIHQIDTSFFQRVNATIVKGCVDLIHGHLSIRYYPSNIILSIEKDRLKSNSLPAPIPLQTFRALRRARLPRGRKSPGR